MACGPRREALGVVMLFCLAIGARAAELDCGPREDAEKASYRALSLDDFLGERPREPGRLRSGGATTILIVTTIAVDELATGTSRDASGRWTARIVGLCIRAYLVKQLSGRARETTRPWDLRHEQGHFDLTQSHALRLEERLYALSSTANDQAAAKQRLLELMRAAYGEQLAACQSEQELYDKQTRHGNHRSAQGRWLALIASRLAAEPPMQARLSR